jgi:HEAT repeat protein
MKDFLAALVQFVIAGVQESKLPVRWIAMGGVGACLLLFLTCALLRTSPEDLLDADSLNEEQIREIAANLLLHEDPTIRERAVAKITAAGKTAGPVLKDLSLNADDPRLQEASLGVLMSIDQEAALTVLDTLMASSNADVRRAAVRCAAGSSDPRATAVLNKAMQDSDSGIRVAATNGLNTQKGRASVSTLEKALQDESPTVRRHAARALRNITGRDYRVQPEAQPR